MKITRKFTTEGVDPFSTTEWVTRQSKISNPDGSIVFEMPNAEVPSSWSQLATDIMVSKYFRKAGVPQSGGPNGIAAHDYEGEANASDSPMGPEKSAKQVIHRLAGCWRHWGEQYGYFDTRKDAQAFEDEMKYMLVHQMAAPNSPQWFNTGLNWAYGITGPAQGHLVADHKTGKVENAKDAYTHPQPHACFIQSVDDDLVNPGGIMDLWTREARLFKYGSGTGTNFSGLRAEGETLAGGGKSSGLMSWLKIGDRAAGAIKSGGTTRRAAKMVCLDLDHPDIIQFVNWKVREEIKVAALVEGMKAIQNEKASPADPETVGETAARLGLTLDYDFNGESYQTVAGQNANNSVRISDKFFESLEEDADWNLYNRLPGENGERSIAQTVSSRELWDQIAYAAWRCADPGVQYDSTINAWHTCPGSGRINASNPCSEYMFLDNTACNLASINLIKFYDAKGKNFDIERFEHAVDLWTITLEISVLMAAFPSEAIAELSWMYRTLGLGYANLGAMLMQAGIAYDSEEGRAVSGCISSIMTGRSYRQSSLLAKEHGPFAGYNKNGNRDNMLRVIRNHRRAAMGLDRQSTEWEDLKIRPVPIDHDIVKSGVVNIANTEHMLTHATKAWDDALKFGQRFGYRNAQTTVIAPTGTIGLLMDCDTTGVEPDFALVKFKKLAGGGYFKIANNSLRPALETLSYSEKQVREIIIHVMGALTCDVAMPTSDGERDASGTFADFLKAKGMIKEDIQKVNDALPSVFELGFAFNAWTLGEDCLARIGVSQEEASAPGFDLLSHLGLTRAQITSLNNRVCGTQTVEGAPHLKDEHLPVFDCANPCGATGTRFIAPEGHIRMMAAAQPFITGAISKTINLPNSANVDDIKACYQLSWELGLKANALYRDGCKLSQPLSTKSDTAKEEEADALEEAVDTLDTADALEEVAADVASAGEVLAAADAEPEVVEKIVERIVHRPMRQRLPDTRRSVTHKFNIAGHEGYLTVGLYEDGMPGELFITMAKEGSTIGGLMDSLGTAVSVALQYGVPVKSLVTKFSHQRFEPAGMTTNRDIPIAKSLVDYIFRWMGIQFIDGYKEQNAPMRPEPTTKAPTVEAKRTPVLKASTSSSSEEGGAPSGSDRFRQPVTEASAGPSVEAMAAAASFSDVKPKAEATVAASTKLAPKSALDAAMSKQQEDAPACNVCGTITVRNGTCYKCLNCGNSMGCS